MYSNWIVGEIQFYGQTKAISQQAADPERKTTFLLKIQSPFDWGSKDTSGESFWDLEHSLADDSGHRPQPSGFLAISSFADLLFSIPAL